MIETNLIDSGRLKLAVIDDEKNIADYFSIMIRRKFYSELTVSTFYSSSDLIESFKQFNFDILVCDINMPEIDGIKLANILRGLEKKVQIIFLTGLNSFENAYEALQMEDVSYILKIDAEETLISVVQQKINKVMQVREKQNNLINLTNENNKLQAAIINDKLKKLIQTGEKDNKSTFNFLPSNIVVILCSKSLSEEEIANIKSIVSSHLQIKIGELLPYKENEIVALVRDTPCKILEEKLELITKEIISKLYISTISTYSKTRFSSNEFYLTIHNIEIFNEKKISPDCSTLVFSYDSNQKEVSEIEDDTKKFNEIQQFIWNNLSSGVSLTTISEFMHYNPSYLSRYFKAKYHKNIKDFIFEIKIKKAKYLLLETDMFVKDISQALGFESISHFFRIFKKETELTPSEFRIKAKKQ